MRKFNFLIGMLCGALLFGGGTAIATGIMAQLTNQTFYINGVKVDNMEIFSIADKNRIGVRELGERANFSVEWDGATNIVYIDTSKPYTPEVKPIENTPPASVAEKMLDGTDYAREDFSANANQSIFDSSYTKAAYNAIRQTIADRDTILSGGEYKYAHCIGSAETSKAVNAVLGYIGGYYTYTMGVETGIKNLYAYPDYFIVKAEVNDFLNPATVATDSFINSLNGLTDKDKVVKIADYICEKLTYDTDYVYGAIDTGINNVFTSQTVVRGVCGDYASAFQYLCQRANIPCVSVRDSDHGWNTVYVNGSWEIIDITNYDVGKSEMWLFSKNYPKQDGYPKRTKFAQEILVQNSTR